MTEKLVATTLVDTSDSANAYSKTPYRTAIDGLRALAVVAVIIHHFNESFLPSGYLGVDIFFVVSGFVITSSLADRASSSLKDFVLDFYTRRIKRLVPALALFVVITSILICLFDSSPVASLRTGVTSLFGLSNLYLLKQASDYFGSAAQLNVFTHTWSLGVEEQFYFLFPFLFWFSGFARLSSNGSRNLFLVMALLSAVSLAVFIYLAKVNQPAAYFLMPSRFWEIGSGCLIFLAMRRSGKTLRLVERIPPLLVVLGIVAVLTIPLQYIVPATIAVVALTAILIACLRAGTAGHAILSSPRVVFIGKISYSLYLWHWGVISLFRWTIGIDWWSIPIAVALMLILATASYRYVEAPLRRAQWSSNRWKSIGYGVGVSAISAGVLVLLLSGASSALYSGGKTQVQEDGPVIRGVSANAAGIRRAGTLVLVGDSHAQHFSAMVGSQANKLNMNFEIISENATAFPTVNIATPVGGLTLAKNQVSNNRMLEKLKKKLQSGESRDRNVIILSSFYRFYFETPSGSRRFQVLTHYDADGKVITREESFRVWLKQLENFAAEFKDTSIVVILSTPEMPGIYPMSLCRKEWFRGSISDKCHLSIPRSSVVDDLNRVNSKIAEQAARSVNLFVFDPTPSLCSAKDDFCRSYAGEYRIYSDEDHLTEFGSSMVSDDFMTFMVQSKVLGH